MSAPPQTSPARAVVLAAHGCGDDLRANARVRALADRLRDRLSGAAVAIAFNLGTPTFAEVLDRLDATRVTVVPLMASAGYFPTQRMPAELAKNARYPDVDLTIAPALGTLDAVKRSAAGRASALLARHGIDDANATVLVVGHGTARNPDSGGTTHDVAAMIRAAHSAVDVRAVFLDQEPLLEDVPPTLDRPAVVVVPYLFGGGDHARVDVPERLGLETDPDDDERDGGGVRVSTLDGRRFVIDRPFGEDDATLDLIVELFRCEAASGSGSESDHTSGSIDGSSASLTPSRLRLRIGTRSSPLARWQTDTLARALSGVGIETEVIPIDTLGDRDLSTPLPAIGQGAFTGDLERLLLAGEIDLAMHSLKDLPLIDGDGVEVAAVLGRGPAEECLVASGGRTLADLPPGATVGTCSARRVAQVRRLRPDLRFRDIRGTVESRVAQVERGDYDAAILAVAGLVRIGLGGKITEAFDADRVLPQAGQGAIAVQVRTGDAAALAACARIDHGPTRRAVACELAFARAADAQGAIVATHATADGDQVTLHARIVTPDGRATDATVAGTDPAAVALDAAARLLAPLSRPTSAGVVETAELVTEGDATAPSADVA